jgi:DNA/RNA-binding domain of Phe-tRNA-synthetase-like protein
VPVVQALKAAGGSRGLLVLSLSRVGRRHPAFHLCSMTGDVPPIEIEPHPLLRPSAFTTVFPRPLAEMPTPSGVTGLLRLDAEAPVQRDEALRLRVRDTLRHWGHKPAGRGKPASEYLVRAVGDGALGPINLAVDVCNVVSLHSGFPIALVDLHQAHPPFRVGQGPDDGRYVFNASGQEMSLRGLICLYDAQGPCGNPVKDAERVKTRGDTTRTLTVLWGVAGFEDRRDAAVAWYREILEGVGGAVEEVLVRCPPPSPGA